MVIKLGKISGELELKTFILYALRDCGGSAHSDLIDDLAGDYVESWFDYVVARSELSDRGLLRFQEDTWNITPLGLSTLEQVESSLPPATRRHLAEDARRCAARWRRERYIFTDAEPDGSGVRVSLLLEGDEGTLLDLKLLLPSQELADRAMDRFRLSAEKIYNSVSETLAGEQD